MQNNSAKIVLFFVIIVKFLSPFLLFFCILHLCGCCFLPLKTAQRGLFRAPFAPLFAAGGGKREKNNKLMCVCLLIYENIFLNLHRS